MSDAIISYRKREPKAALQITENAMNYADLLAQNIYKEDNILYSMADKHIPEERLRELPDEFEKVEQDNIGTGKHQELHKVLQQLRDMYLRV